MKNRKKLLTLVCCLAIVAAVSLGATLAYLTASDSVANIFTVGKIVPPEDSGFLDEAKVDEYGKPDESGDRVDSNTYKLLPGHTYTKDPTVHIGAESESCYIFVKVDNGIAAVTEAIDPTKTENEKWQLLDNQNYPGIYYQKYDKDAKTPKYDFVVFDEFKVLGTATATNLDAVKDNKIVVNAYIIQSDGFKTAALAYAAYLNQANPVSE